LISLIMYKPFRLVQCLLVSGGIIENKATVSK
jgi:hypothetical protein